MPNLQSPQLFPFDGQDRANQLKDCFRAWRDSSSAKLFSGKASGELNDASARVYQEMWFAFAEYCGAYGLSLDTLTEPDLERFMQMRARGEGKARMLPKGQTLSPRYAWRMLTLIDRVTSYIAHREGLSPNSAARDMLTRPEFRYANARQKDPLPKYYVDSQVAQLIRYLNEAAGVGTESTPPWKSMRDCAAVALMLGAGLAPGDVRAASMTGVYVEAPSASPWKIAVPGNGNSPARETPIAAWAATLLAQWMNVRAAQGIPGDVLFPSTLSGKPLSHASCYKVCKAVLAEAGMDDDDGGVFKLRHTFALRQLVDGRSEVEVARWLGLVDLNGMAKYRKIVKLPIELA